MHQVSNVLRKMLLAISFVKHCTASKTMKYSPEFRKASMCATARDATNFFRTVFAVRTAVNELQKQFYKEKDNGAKVKIVEIKFELDGLERTAKY